MKKRATARRSYAQRSSVIYEASPASRKAPPSRSSLALEEAMEPKFLRDMRKENELREKSRKDDGGEETSH